MTTTDARKRLAEKQEERKAFAARLAKEHLRYVDELVTDKVFDFAWEAGHASGEHEVEQVYADLAEIVRITEEVSQW